MNLTSFVVDVAQASLDDLRARLARTRWPDEVDGAGWDYGASLAYMRELVEHWRIEFDWRAAERAMNTVPHFRVEVDGIGIHVIHQRGRGPAPKPRRDSAARSSMPERGLCSSPTGRCIRPRRASW